MIFSVELRRDGNRWQNVPINTEQCCTLHTDAIRYNNVFNWNLWLFGDNSIFYIFEMAHSGSRAENVRFAFAELLSDKRETCDRAVRESDSVNYE